MTARRGRVATVRAGKQADSASAGERPDGINVVALRGRLSRPADSRVLPSGDRLVTLEVSVPRHNEAAESVPVVWIKAPVSAAILDTDDEVVVVGRVRRRFFRAGGATQSRTEVVADAVVPARRAGRARLALVGLASRLEDAAGPAD